jgi:cardiolipin synthase A/B
VNAVEVNALEWLSTGREIFPAMLEAIAAAREAVRLETYIYTDGHIGRQFLAALVAAQARGVRVQVLVDALGSWRLPDDFFAPLVTAGGEARRFNPLRLWRFGVRDHRKLLVCDGRVAFTGGFNLADEYDGDGVTRGWCDVGARIANPALAQNLAAAFDELFALADFHRRPLLRLRGFQRRRPAGAAAGEMLLSRPGRGAGEIQRSLRQDLAGARDVLAATAYFLPPWRLRRDLLRVARRGGRVRLILAGRTDVPVAQLAARNWYRRLLRAGVEVYEYQPQILHAKLVAVDGAVYTGSANLDVRSLKLNYELMLRFAEPGAVAGAREVLARMLSQCRRIESPDWWQAQGFLARWKFRWANFLLARVDPFVALRQFRSAAGD